MFGRFPRQQPFAPPPYNTAVQLPVQMQTLPWALVRSHAFPKQDRSRTFRALSDVKVIELPAKHFHDLAGKDNKIGYVVMKNIATLICQRLRSSNFAVKHFGLWGKIDEEK